jgi:hypothetical protein
MGVLTDQIQAVRTNTALTADEKRAAIYQIKVDALFNELLSGATDGNGKFIGKTFTFNGFTITVHAVGVTVDPSQPKQLVLDLTLAKGAESFRDVYYVTNPPVIATDGTENLARVAGEMVTSWWRGS